MDSNTNTEEKKPSFIKRLQKFFYQTKDVYSTLTDENYRHNKHLNKTIVNFNFINDYKTAKDFFSINLATKRGVTPELKTIYQKYKTKELYLNKNEKITPLGHIKFKSNSNSVRLINFGITKNNAIKVSYQNIEGVPLWSKFNPKQFKDIIKHIQPKENEILSIDKNFFDKDLNSLDKEKINELNQKFNTIVINSIEQNHYLKKDTLLLNEKIINEPKQYEGRIIKLPGFQNGKDAYHILKESNDNHVRFMTLNKPKGINDHILLNKQELKDINKDPITIVSQLNKNIYLGQNLNNERRIGVKANQEIKWMKDDEFLKEKTISNDYKKDIIKTIQNRNFLDERTLKVYDNIIVKQKYGTGELYAAQKNDPSSKFIPITNKELDAIKSGIAKRQDNTIILDPKKSNNKLQL
ncbi:hypothetical protein FHS04_002803 [Mesoflavibacter sabulilitoris]|uniref:DUF3945 domain-containing protein n=1 Tax=Mesoflavibacter zeaxanthinifaciens subsp. sabulilitoris TaxID=1520893 RepID=A0A2T1NNN9_9FLAO|nr:hypothetical protein [Mesoflavibacter zeaxanthinifaciens]MBB3125259.1 hypothetical protein [Mesoflavibacter zeaxanthinifaciens subsp. sabulilitoris]PSG94494.1 hypothetical protein C7H61_00745 [Mesoflavibacter zeaxanthinifaciens subsp. sabulilitoris]